MLEGDEKLFELWKSSSNGEFFIRVCSSKGEIRVIEIRVMKVRVIESTVKEFKYEISTDRVQTFLTLL